MQSEARKLALITGGVSGIGAALVERLLNQGFRVVVADAVAATKPELLRASGGLLEYVEVDVADRAQVVGLFSKLAASCETLDLVVNCAGISCYGEALEIPTAQWDRVLKVNLCGTIDVTLAAYGLMRGRGGGTIVNLASMSTFLLPPLFAPYITSKAAIVGFSRALSIEAEIHGVNVAVACPGNVRTPMLGGWKQSPLTPAMDAGEAAATILAGVDKGRKMMVFPLYAKAFYFLDRLDGAILNPFRREILRRARLRKRAPDQV